MTSPTSTTANVAMKGGSSDRLKWNHTVPTTSALRGRNALGAATLSPLITNPVAPFPQAMRPMTIDTALGPMTLARAYYHCAHCRRGFAPLDSGLGLDRGSTSFGVRDKIARIAAMANDTSRP
jgi:hypothetical protein